MATTNPTGTRTYDEAQEDERIRAALIITATTCAERLGIGDTQLHEVTEAIIGDLGTMDESGICRLCVHAHDPLRVAAADVAAELRENQRPSPKSLAAWAASIELALAVGHRCPCDLPQVAANV